MEFELRSEQVPAFRLMVIFLLAEKIAASCMDFMQYRYCTDFFKLTDINLQFVAEIIALSDDYKLNVNCKLS